MTTVLASLNERLHALMTASPEVYLLGEDILDPYGGAFGVTRGLSSRFPERVLTTPISEGAIAGVGTGMALRGLRPVVEIMFGDFLLLAADQLVNHAAKFRWLYGERGRVPLVIRTPMGAGRGYGATHSQSLEKLFLGVPGLRVVAVNALADPGLLLENAVLGDAGPVLFVEHKQLYPAPVLVPGTAELADYFAEWSDGPFPACTLRPRYQRPCATVACYGVGLELARAAAAELLMEHELAVEIVLLSQLSPAVPEPVAASAVRTRRLVTVEEGTLTAGWGAEMVARLGAAAVPLSGVRRVAARDEPIASARALEQGTLPATGHVRRAVLELTGVGGV